MKHTFIHEDVNGGKVVVESQMVGLGEVLEAFKQYLLAVGYSVKGELTVEDYFCVHNEDPFTCDHCADKGA